MLTPIEIQNKSFKSGIGYDKKDVEGFFREVISCYEDLYKENVVLNDKIGVLSEGIQYYKSIEKTLQKALVLAERTSDETKESAIVKAKIIEDEAHAKAKDIILDSRRELDQIKLKTMELTHQYEIYKAQFKQLAATQLELLNSSTFNINFANVYSQEEDFDEQSKVEADVDLSISNQDIDTKHQSMSEDKKNSKANFSKDTNQPNRTDSLEEMNNRKKHRENVQGSDRKDDSDTMKAALHNRKLFAKDRGMSGSMDELINDVVPKKDNIKSKFHRETKKRDEDMFEFIDLED